MIWQIITGEYPPQPGGVSDHTKVVAEGLAAAGDEVHVWAPAALEGCGGDHRIKLHRLPGHFGVPALARLDQRLTKGRGRVLIEYVPQAFGMRGMNLPFALWLYTRRHLQPTLMFHEVMFPLERGQPFRHNLIGATNLLMARLVAGAARRIFVSTPAWIEVLRRRVGVSKDISWLPIPSSLAPVRDEASVRALRRRYAAPGHLLVAHFSTYPSATCATLSWLIPQLLARDPGLHILLLGYGNADFFNSSGLADEDMGNRIHPVGDLSARDLSLHLAVSDLMLQPYPDGVSTRRGTLIAALAHGRPTITTSGAATEAFWHQNHAVMIVPEADLLDAVRRMAADAALRQRFATAAVSLYRDCFDVRYSVDRLRGEACESL